jgi:cell division protein FtsZ
MAEMGMAMMGAGFGSGDSRAVDAAMSAISSPLLEDVSIGGARGVLVNITACKDFGIQEMNEAVELIQDQAHDDANIIVGLVHNEDLEDEVRVTVIATGFGERVSDGHRDDDRVVSMDSARSSRARRAALMDDSIDDPMAGGIDQEELAFEQVSDADSKGSVDIPAYIRRWRERASRMRS